MGRSIYGAPRKGKLAAKGAKSIRPGYTAGKLTKKKSTRGGKGKVDSNTTIAKSINSKPKHWWEILDVLLAAGANRIMLVGPPGTGKSTTAALTAKKCYRITMTEGTGIEDLIGMYQLRDGQTIWVDGPATKALREGATLLMDEIDHTPGEVQSLNYSLLDDDPQIMLPTGEHVKAASGYRVIATSNNNMSSLPDAIVDRMEACLLAVAPHPDAMKDLAPQQSAVVSNFYRSMNTEMWKWTGALTLRRMRAFAKLKDAGIDETIVADATFGKAGREVLSCLVTAGK